MKGAVNQLALGGGDLEIAGDRPVFKRIGIFTHHAFTRARGVQQDGIERFWHGGTKDAAIEVGQGDVADPTAADIRMQNFNPAR